MMGAMATAHGSTPDAPMRRGRPRKGAEPLSRRAIIDATLAVVAEGGIDAISLRAVARRLGVDAKSLYNHVDGKEGLLDAMAEEVLGSIELPSRTGDPAADLKAIAHAFRASALVHSAVAPLILTRQLTSLEALAPVEAVLASLADAGFGPRESVRQLRLLVAAVVGMLLREYGAGPAFGTADVAGIAAREADLTESSFPHVAEAAQFLARFDAAAEFDVAVGQVVSAVLSAAR